MAFSDPRTRAIADFLQRIGIACEAADLAGEDCFLPGLLLDRGRLRVDEALLRYPGDLLHEAGHVAVAPAQARESLSGESTAVPGVDMTTLEAAAIPWSYAAALAAGIDPAEVFHDAGYHGHARGLLFTFTVGAGIGVNLLEDAGMTAGPVRARELGVPPFPHMLRWLNE